MYLVSTLRAFVKVVKAIKNNRAQTRPRVVPDVKNKQKQTPRSHRGLERSAAEAASLSPQVSVL